MGNHDVYWYEEAALSGVDHYRRVFAREPEGALVEIEGFRLALLDTVEISESPFAPFDLVTGAFMEGRGGAVVRGSLSAVQHDILAEVAAPRAAPSFVFLHHPPQPFTSFPPVVFGLREEDSARLHAHLRLGQRLGRVRRPHSPQLPAPVVQLGAGPGGGCPGQLPVRVRAHRRDAGGLSLQVGQCGRKSCSGTATRASAFHRRYGLGPGSMAWSGWEPSAWPPDPSIFIPLIQGWPR